LRPTVVVARLLDRTLHVLRAKAVRPRRIRSSAMNCGRCESSRASRPRHSYSPLSGVARSPPQASPSCSPAPAMRPRLASLRSTHTCYRNACGYALANKGIDTRTIGAYLGHRSINRSKRYWRFSESRGFAALGHYSLGPCRRRVPVLCRFVELETISTAEPRSSTTASASPRP
jgi:hypothetical protein